MVLRLHVLYPCLESVDMPTGGQYEQVSHGLWSEWSGECRRFLHSALVNCKLPEDLISKSTNAGTSFICVESVEWHATSINNYRQVIDGVCSTSSVFPNSNTAAAKQQMTNILFVSLMDGSETDGWPGVSVVKYLEGTGRPFTGCSTAFFAKDVDKSVVKRHLPAQYTPAYSRLSKSSQIRICDNGADESGTYISIKESTNPIENPEVTEVQLKLPVIVKPSFMSGSIGLDDKSIIRSAADLEHIVRDADYYVEEFIEGREFTCFACGSPVKSDEDDKVITLNPCEREFNQSLPSHQRFLSFDRKWDGWETEWWYRPMSTLSDDKKDSEIAKAIQFCAANVFRHVGGDGYCRMDLRMSESDGRLYVVDLNCNCSIDGQDDTALGMMLKSTDFGSQKMTLTDLMDELLKLAVVRSIRSRDAANSHVQ